MINNVIELKRLKTLIKQIKIVFTVKRLRLKKV